MIELKGMIEPVTTLSGSVNIDPVGVIGKPETPLFDLAYIGLPAITPDGVPVELETDTTEILAAVSKGAVVFKLNANLGNEVIPVDVVGSSLCSNVGEEVAFVSCPFVMEELGFVLLSVYPQKIEAVYMPHSMIAESGGVTAEPISIDLSAYESDGRIEETFADGSSVTTVMEFDDNGKPTKITDSNGNVTTLTW